MAKAPTNSPNSSKQVVTIFIILACIGAVFGTKYFLDAKRNASDKLKTMKVKGDPSAPIKLVEYIDFQCPACAYGANMIKEYMKLHPGQIFLEMKYYPLAMHPHAFTSSIYTECALKQGKFWELHDLILERQKAWSKLKDVRSTFDGMAQEIELNNEKLQACIQSPEANEAVVKSRQEGDLLGIKSTPSYLVNDKLVVGFKNLKRELDSLLK